MMYLPLLLVPLALFIAAIFLSAAMAFLTPIFEDEVANPIHGVLLITGFIGSSLAFITSISGAIFSALAPFS